MSTDVVAAVDIGGTKIAAGLVDDTGRVRHQIQVATPAGPAAIVEVVAELVTGLRSRAVVRAVGVGAPGVIDPAAGVVRSATDILPGWAGTPIRELLAARLGLPVAVINDVGAAAVGAARGPELRGYPEILHVSVGTGIGGALIRNGQLVSGPHAVAGAVAHLLVPVAGVIPCGCGRFDHLEAVAAGPAIAAAIAKETGSAPLPLTGAIRVPGAEAVIAAAARLLGRTLAGLVCAVDVDAVALGGGVVHGVPGFAGLVRDALHAEALAPLRTLPVLVPGAGADAPLLGAAHLARQTVAGADARHLARQTGVHP
ncbi:ROK family protein [Actinoplanes sp. L3-i22]|uniref:ROK family protein n=1 Tax=Actinoplanes sp. L3-i22 TaxID=2836373 RepID=UPI001C77206A|nr:ROK family protein [Actinoplanes sp. L3-i22]BCY09861.1 transcriptional regulator [Actinoplanes sp. L3-i22]